MNGKNTACNDPNSDKIMKIYMEVLVYLQDDDYMLKSQEYQVWDLSLEEQKAVLKRKSMEAGIGKETEELLNRYDDTWQNMNFIYRTYGPLDGLMTGLGLNKQFNEKFYQKLCVMVKDRW